METQSTPSSLTPTISKVEAAQSPSSAISGTTVPAPQETKSPVTNSARDRTVQAMVDTWSKMSKEDLRRELANRIRKRIDNNTEQISKEPSLLPNPGRFSSGGDGNGASNGDQTKEHTKSLGVELSSPTLGKSKVSEKSLDINLCSKQVLKKPKKTSSKKLLEPRPPSLKTHQVMARWNPRPPREVSRSHLLLTICREKRTSKKYALSTFRAL
jgi:hypothetical protein